ncbi:MAG: hypothetical protein P1V18_04840 [Candidatus Gracilibacteria bacterium]|nr:hypothetical protein [Candidatus Gracilibacteria bacterium]
MKYYLIIVIIILLAFTSLELIPSTKAPSKGKNLLSASIQLNTVKSTKSELASSMFSEKPIPSTESKLQILNSSISKAAILISEGNRDEAGVYLHSLIENHPDGETKLKALSLLNIYHTFDQHRDADTSYLWTLFAKQLGEFEEYDIAITLAEKATQLNENYRDAWLIKGYCEMKTENLDESEKSLLKAYQLDPGNTQIQYLLGVMYFKQKKPELSSQYLLYAKQNDHIHLQDIREKLAENAILSENYALASHYFEEALTNSTDTASILSRLIWLHIEKLQQPDKATLFAEKRIIEYPSDPESHQLMSWVLTKQDELEKALKYLEKSEALKK